MEQGHTRTRFRWMAVTVMCLLFLVIVPTVFGAPGEGASAKAEPFPEHMAEMTFVVLSAVSLFIIYLRARIRRVRRMHELS